MNDSDEERDLAAELDEMTMSQLIELHELLKTVMYNRARQPSLSDTQEKP